MAGQQPGLSGRLALPSPTRRAGVEASTCECSKNLAEMHARLDLLADDVERLRLAVDRRDQLLDGVARTFAQSAAELSAALVEAHRPDAVAALGAAGRDAQDGYPTPEPRNRRGVLALLRANAIQIVFGLVVGFVGLLIALYLFTRV